MASEWEKIEKGVMQVINWNIDNKKKVTPLMDVLKSHFREMVEEIINTDFDMTVFSAEDEAGADRGVRTLKEYQRQKLARLVGEK